MELVASALILSVLPHGEHGAVVRLLTPDHGLRAGYVRGGRSRALRPVLAPGNQVQASLRARTPDALAQLSVEPERSRAALAFDRAAGAGLAWVCALLAAALPEDEPHPAIFAALGALLDGMERQAPEHWAANLARFERDLLADLGFGLDLQSCALTGGTVDLVFVSPRTGRAATRQAGARWADQLLPLPALLHLDAAGAAPARDIIAALTTTGHFLRRDVVAAQWDRLAPLRERLLAIVDKSAGGPPPAL